MTDGVCSVETCDRLVTKRTWCSAHYNRFVKLGDVKADVPLRARYVGPQRTTCSVAECDLPTEGTRAMCSAHRARQRRLGDLRANQPVRTLPSRRVQPPQIVRDAHDPAKECTYATAHDRTRRLRGAASLQPCVKCGESAAQWAYRGGAKHEFSGIAAISRNRQYLYKMYWSADPADYDPMCGPCHKKYDTLLAHLRWLAEVAPDLVDEVKRRTGAMI